MARATRGLAGLGEEQEHLQRPTTLMPLVHSGSRCGILASATTLILIEPFVIRNLLEFRLGLVSAGVFLSLESWLRLNQAKNQRY